MVDANILIDFIHLERLDLLGRISRYHFWVPDQVRREVHRRAQRRAIEHQIELQALRVLAITDLDELGAYEKYTHIIGDGEAASLAVALHRHWILASDEKRRVRAMVIQTLGEDHMLDTAGLLAMALRLGLLSTREVERMLNILARHGFTLESGVREALIATTAGRSSGECDR